MVKKCLFVVVLVVMSLCVGLAAVAGPLDDIKAGNQAAQSGNLKKAIELYTKAIDSKQLSRANLAVAYTNRGAAQDDMGQTDLAVLDFNRAIKADARYAIAYYNRSFAYEKRGLMDMALRDMERALALEPEDQHYQQRMQYLQFKSGK